MKISRNHLPKYQASPTHQRRVLHSTTHSHRPNVRRKKPFRLFSVAINKIAAPGLAVLTLLDLGILYQYFKQSHFPSKSSQLNTELTAEPPQPKLVKAPPTLSEENARKIFDMEAPPIYKSFSGIRPHYPGYESGVTLGAGVDLNWTSKEELRTAFGNFFTEQQYKVLEEGIKLTGDNAKKFVERKDVRAITISRDDAFKVFRNYTIPKYYKMAQHQWGPTFDYLSDEMRTGLLAITYQRPNNEGPYRTNLKNIRGALDEWDISTAMDAFNAELERFRSKKADGLVNRYEKIKNLFDKGCNNSVYYMAVNWEKGSTKLAQSNTESSVSVSSSQKILK